MKRYFNNNGCRRKLTKHNLFEYLDAKDAQWGRIWCELRNRSGEREIESLQDQITMLENALEEDSDRWNNHRDGVYAEYCDWTKAEIDADWKEHLEDLPKQIAELNNQLHEMIIEMNLTCRPERTAKAFIERFGNRVPFDDRLELRVRKELYS